ncbi:MAG TPA: Mur ligase family protein, partial [Candidatus Limnocylindrales bacterium]
MRLIEIRLLEGPNVYRLEPVVKVEVAIGRRRTWYGQRVPPRHALVRLGAAVPRRHWPPAVEAIGAWARRLRTEHGEGTTGLRVHRSSDPGHWILTWPWSGADRAIAIAEAAVALGERNVAHERGTKPSPAGARLLESWRARIEGAKTQPPALIRDADRRVPIVSITGTNGKSTVTRLITHILLLAGRRVGTTTSDGVLVDERMVDPGDWTGPGGAAQVLGRDDIDVAVLETARGGILLRGLGYESNDASVLTNVTSDHLDLQGIHTLPELAEVKSVVCRVTKPSGWVVLNGDDPFVAAVAGRVEANVALFSLRERSAAVRRHLSAGRRAYLLRDSTLVEVEGDRTSVIAQVGDVPIAIGGLARHNIANALAASGAARGLGATLEQVRHGLTDFRPSSERSPGRLNIFRVGAKVVVVDFAHNEAGVGAILDVADGIASGTATGGGGRRKAPITMIIGTAGDRPDDTLRGIGRLAGERAQRIAIKETLKYLRGRTRESMVGELLAGVRAARRSTSDIPVYESETEALRTELTLNGTSEGVTRARVIVLMCHEEREEV